MGSYMYDVGRGEEGSGGFRLLDDAEGMRGGGICELRRPFSNLRLLLYASH